MRRILKWFQVIEDGQRQIESWRTQVEDAEVKLRAQEAVIQV